MQSLTSYDYNKGKDHQGKPISNNGRSSSDSDEDKIPPLSNHKREKLEKSARDKMRLLATQVRPYQTLVEDYSLLDF